MTPPAPETAPPAPATRLASGSGDKFRAAVLVVPQPSITSSSPLVLVAATLAAALLAIADSGYGHHLFAADGCQPAVAADPLGTDDPTTRRRGDCHRCRQYALDPCPVDGEWHPGHLSTSAGVAGRRHLAMVMALYDAGAQAKAAAGISTAPDGFAVNASGNPLAPELAGRWPASEPTLDLLRTAWQGAQAGFRVCRDWLASINQYPTTQGLPLYITATNTFATADLASLADEQAALPAQNYPVGWLTNALHVINQEPQIQALCWFLDAMSGDNIAYDPRTGSFTAVGAWVDQCANCPCLGHL